MTWALAWQAITKLVPWWVRVAMICALAAATWAAWKTHQHDMKELDEVRAEADDFKRQVAQAAERARAEDEMRDLKSQALVAKLEKDHAENLADRLAARDAEWNRLLAAHADAGRARAQEPVRQPAGGCAGVPDCLRLADVFQRHRDATRAEVGLYRQRVGQLLQACEADGLRKADALAEIVEWALAEREIYQPTPAQ